jgi:single stranded DNA-binding protein
MLRVTVFGQSRRRRRASVFRQGDPDCAVRIAVNQVRSNANGEREESTEWFRINVAGREANYASRLQKGQRVLVDGRLQIARFVRRDGTPGVGFEVWADEVQNLSGRSTADSGDGPTAVSAAVNEGADEAVDDSDLPF